MEFGAGGELAQVGDQPNMAVGQVFSLRRETTEQDCYGRGVHFEGAWAQKWAQFKKLADFRLL
jgi:hypothetical protein